MYPMLRLYEDVLVNDGESSLPALPRMIFVVHGTVVIANRTLRDEGTFGGEGAVTLKAGGGGATVWRWELVADDLADDTGGEAAGRDIVSRRKLAARLETVPKGALLLRGDSVAFPPGGCAYLHRHQGPGIRCLIEGGLRVDTRGHSTSYGPGGAWYEAGPDGVFAQAADRPNSLRPRDDSAARLFGKKFGRISQRGRQGQAEISSLQDLRRHAANAGGGALKIFAVITTRIRPCVSSSPPSAA